MNTIIKRRVLISMLFIGLVLMGIFSSKYLPMESYPNAELPTLSVNISSSTELDPTYIENKAVIPVEGVISSIGGIEEISASIYSRSSKVDIALKQGTDLKYAYLQLEAKIKALAKNVPEEFTLRVNKSSEQTNSQFMNLRILGENDIDYVRNVADADIVPYLENINGIASVSVYGGRQKSIEVIVDPERCKALNITKNTISNLISSNLAEKTFVGSAYENNKRYFVNVTAEYLATEDLGSIVVAEGPILLKDIAEIHFGVKEEDSYSRTNGKEVIQCKLTKSPVVNIIELSDKVRLEIEKLNKELESKGISIEIEKDEAEEMRASINTIIDLAISGAILAILVLVMFLRKLRIVSIVAFAIPISVFSSFYFFYLFGITLNTLTLMGIALAVGMLLDNAIVVLENIYRLKGLGVSDDEACVRGTTEVWKSILASTITTITVFLPFLFADNYLVKLIGKNIGISIITTLTISLIVALLLIPMAMNHILKKYTNNFNFSSFPPHNRLVQIYVAILKTALRRPTQVLLFSLIALFVTVGLSQTLTLNTLKEVDIDNFRADITMPSGSTLEKTDEIIRLYEDELKGVPEIKEFSCRVEAEQVSFNIYLKDDFEEINKRSIAQIKENIIKLANKVRITEIELITGSSFSNSSQSDYFGDAALMKMFGLGRQEEKIVLKGEDYEKMYNFSELIKYQLEELENISSVSNSSNFSTPEAQLYFDQYLMNTNEVTSRNVSSELTNARPKNTTETRYKTDNQEYDIIIQDNTYDENDSKTQTLTLEDLENLNVTNESKALIPLKSFSHINLGQGKGRIQRHNQEKELTMKFYFNSEINESKELLEAARLEIDELIQSLDIPTGIAVEVVHEDRDMNEFIFLLLAAAILIYMILAAVFESFTNPIVLMFTIPLAVIGSLLALLFTSNAVQNANVYVGFIILVGIVVNNSIILIDYTSLLRKNGNRKVRAIIMAGLSRLRPILITAITTIVAMIPLAMGEGGYVGGLGAPFAITVVGGLITSTLLTLVIIPTLYSGLEDALHRLRTQSLFMKGLQLMLLLISVISIYLFCDSILNQIFYLIATVILVPGVTWFIESSLRRAKSNIIAADEELVITIRNLVKIYGRPSKFNREWNSGRKIRQRLGLQEYYYSVKDLQIFVWLLPIFAFMIYFTFFYQVLFFWAMIFALCTWFMSMKILDVIYQLCVNRTWQFSAKILEYTTMGIYYIGPLLILNWGNYKFSNSGGAVFLGLFWYAGIAARYLSDKINKENINIDLIDGRFRMLRKTILRLAAQTPFIGVKKKQFKALSSVSMEIRSGMFGLLGPNGAGKTTLMRIICGVFEQSYGKIFINGIDTQKKREELQGLIGYLPQEFGTYENLTAWEFLEYQSLLKGIYDKQTRENRIEEVLTAVHMFENKDKKIGGFSGGMKQRIGIAQTLLNLPRILVVDEPTAGLDPRERIRFRNLLVELSRNRIVIFSTHIIEDIASSCNQVGVINKGVLKYWGNPTDMADIAKDVTWTFDVPAKDFAKLSTQLLIVHHIRQGDTIRVRCLSEKKPAENAERILPALEDSYLWLLRNVKIQNNEQFITQN